MQATTPLHPLKRPYPYDSTEELQRRIRVLEEKNQRLEQCLQDQSYEQRVYRDSKISFEKSSEGMQDLFSYAAKELAVRLSQVAKTVKIAGDGFSMKELSEFNLSDFFSTHFNSRFDAKKGFEMIEERKEDPYEIIKFFQALIEGGKPQDQLLTLHYPSEILKVFNPEPVRTLASASRLFATAKTTSTTIVD